MSYTIIAMLFSTINGITTNRWNRIGFKCKIKRKQTVDSINNEHFE